MSQKVKTSTRMSAGLATFIRSLSENENAATRALLLIGADQLGIDPTLVADDLRMTITARLPAEVYAILLAMWNRVDHNAPPSATPPQGEARRGQDRAQEPDPAVEAPTVPAVASDPIAKPNQHDHFSDGGFDFDTGE